MHALKCHSNINIYKSKMNKFTDRSEDARTATIIDIFNGLPWTQNNDSIEDRIACVYCCFCRSKQVIYASMCFLVSCMFILFANAELVSRLLLPWNVMQTTKSGEMWEKLEKKSEIIFQNSLKLPYNLNIRWLLLLSIAASKCWKFLIRLVLVNRTSFQILFLFLLCSGFFVLFTVSLEFSVRIFFSSSFFLSTFYSLFGFGYGNARTMETQMKIKMFADSNAF